MVTSIRGQPADSQSSAFAWPHTAGRQLGMGLGQAAIDRLSRHSPPTWGLVDNGHNHESR